MDHYISYYVENYFQGFHLITVETIDGMILLTYEGKDGYVLEKLETLGM